MTAIVMALGIFYLLAAALVLRRVCMEWFLNPALHDPNARLEPDRYRIIVIAASASLYGAAGLALIGRSNWAVWLLGAALLIQALYYAYVAFCLWLKPSHDLAAERWRQAWSGALVSTAAFALVSYATRIGVLT